VNKTEALDRLTKLESEASELRKILEAPEKLPGLWKPEPGEVCWHISQQGGVRDDRQCNLGSVNERISYGNCFPFRETAEKAAPLVARANKIIAAALQADPDAGERNDKRIHSVALGSGNCGRWVAHHFVPTDYPLVVFVHTEDQACEMARILNAEGVK